MNTVYAWGYGDILAWVLNGISMLVTQAEYVTWLKIAILISTSVIIMAWIRGRASGEGGIALEAGLRNPWYPVTYFLASYMIFLAFVKITTTVTVHDRTTGNNEVVTNVPIGVAWPLAFFSTFELKMGELIETTFGVPNNISYTDTGFFSGIVALKSAVDFRVKDERLMGNINNFSVDCVVPAILSGDISRDNLLNGDFVAELNNVNPALATTYRDSSNNLLVLDCQTALGNIIADMNAYVNPTTGEAFAFLEKVTGLGARLSPVLNESLTYFLGYTGSAQDFLMHNIFMNQFLIAQTSWLQANGVSASQVAVGTALAERQLASQGAVSGFLARSYMPVIKGIMTVITVASVPIVVILLMLGGFLYSRRVILTGITTVLLWLSLWHIVEVVLNMIVMVKTGSLLQDLLGSGWSSMALYKQSLISSEVMRYANMVGQYYWSIPFFSLLIAGGFSVYTMNSLAGSGAGVVSGASSGAVAQAATGSFKAGEVGINNIRMNTFTDRILTSDVFTSGIVNRNNWTESQAAVRDPVSGAQLNGSFSPDGNSFTGKVEAGSYSGSGVWQRDGDGWRLQNGTALATTSEALKKITGGQMTGLTNAQVTMRNGQVASVKGIDEDTGAQVTIRRGEDGKLWMTYEKGGAKAEAVSNDGGQSWQTTRADLPIMARYMERFAQQLSESIETAQKVQEALRKEDGLANTSTNTFATGFGYSWDISTGKGQANENERTFGKELIKNVGAKALEQLGKEGHVRKDGTRISEQEVRAKGAIKLGLPNLLKQGKLPFKLPANVGVDTVFMTREGWVVKDSKGQYWFFKRTEDEWKSVQEAWKTTVSGKNKDFMDSMEKITDKTYTDANFKEDLQNFRKRVGSYVAQIEDTLRNKLEHTKQNSREIVAEAAHLFLQSVADDLFGGDVRKATEWAIDVISNPRTVQGRLESVNKQIQQLQSLVESNDLSEDEKAQYQQKIQQLQKESQYLSTLTGEGKGDSNLVMGIMDKVMDKFMQDKNITKPDANAENIRKAAGEAKKEGYGARNVEVKAPSKDAGTAYRNTTKTIEDRREELNQEFKDKRSGTDVQIQLYDKYARNKDFMTFKDDMSKFNNDLRELAGLYGQRDAFEQKFAELKAQRDEIASKITSAENELYADVSTLSKLGVAASDIWGLITNEDKLKEYEEFVEGLPNVQKANYIDPNIIKGMRERWMNIMRTKGSLNILDAAINQSQGNIDKAQELIKAKIGEISKNKDGRAFNIARDMYEGNYDVYGGDATGPKRITTDTEVREKSHLEWDKYRVKDNDTIIGAP
ncbi:conjugal transfer protein TraG N-terminal domain-containing protein [Hydrogenivirga sp. 128-5-R1-1]|uniref:conjugal transfer protein TraG N-terminal domain-containing protein n=1 Tax=Hydrogenivirga sp. 128-5-R1-1 TaxID=392423 RepID=UPI00015F1894|nr:conjugal transfer protein TraG N-terminal domain-containing protein [Hydrogenivirga sp. 128-5-R1-1]EDP75383.1 mating pair stabilization and pilus assembly protein [Hydrogenivirga sp. 128-5-R1-1]